jgi:hypothetical protein
MRSLLEVDTTDLPNEVADVFLRDGSERIALAEKRWPGFEVRGSLITEVGEGLYPMPADFTDVAAVIHPFWGVLDFISLEAGEAIWAGSTDTVGEPRCWSVQGGEIRIFPRPAVEATLTLRGFRGMADWVADGAGAVPDLPRSFDIAIAYMAVSLAYAQIEDADQAALYMERAVEKISLAKAHTFDTHHKRPIVLNGAPGVGMSYARWVRNSAAGSF